MTNPNPAAVQAANPTASSAAPLARPSETTLSIFSSEAGLVLGQRMAKMLSASTLVPPQYQGEQGLPNAIIAIDMAQRMGANPLMIMQNLYIVHGRPAWSSQFLIACLNACKRFSPLRFEVSGEGDNWGCRAIANDIAGNLCEGPRVTIAMAKAEGWMGKSGSKWKTMPELMLRYRAATFFARTFAPELTMGIPSQDEVIDIEGPANPAGGVKRGAPAPLNLGDLGDPMAIADDLGDPVAAATTGKEGV